MQPFRKKCTNGTQNPNFGLNWCEYSFVGLFSINKKKLKKQRLKAAGSAVSRFFGWFQGKTLDTYYIMFNDLIYFLNSDNFFLAADCSLWW